MSAMPTTQRIHPLMAGAAVSVTLASLVAMAAMTGLLPNSHGSTAPNASGAAIQAVDNVAPAVAPAAEYPAPVVRHHSAPTMQRVRYEQTPQTAAAMQTVQANADAALPSVQQQPLPQAAPVAQVQSNQQVANNQTERQTERQAERTAEPAPAVQKPTSGIGIATGAVIGGLIGNQIGGGSGRTLATLAGVIGGGYFGNEVEKRTRQ